MAFLKLGGTQRPGGDKIIAVTVDVPEAPPPTAQDYEMVAVDRISTHPDNARKGSLDTIRESIRTNGFYGACVVQRSTGHILVGNHRYLAAIEEGLEEVPVVWVDKSDAEARRLLLVDNRTTDLSAYDDDLLAILLAAVEEDDAGLAGTGYVADDVAVLLAVLDAGPNSDLDYGDVLDDGLTPAERLQSWQEAGIRSLILPYSISDYEAVVAALAKVRDEHGVETNAAAIRCLLGL
jgi:hypothetical protein